MMSLTGLVEAVIHTDATPTITSLDVDDSHSTFLLELVQGALGVVLTAGQLRALIEAGINAEAFDPDKADAEERAAVARLN